MLNAVLDDQYPATYCDITYKTVKDVMENVLYLHFTAVGKPWVGKLKGTESQEHQKLWNIWNQIDNTNPIR